MDFKMNKDKPSNKPKVTLRPPESEQAETRPKPQDPLQGKSSVMKMDEGRKANKI